VAAVAATPEAPAAKAHAEPRARHQRGERGGERGGDRSRERPEAHRADAPRAQPDRDNGSRDTGAPVIGFGDDIPAFMLIRRRGAGTASVDAPGFVPGPELSAAAEDDEDQR
jgi:hypothetical protein